MRPVQVDVDGSHMSYNVFFLKFVPIGLMSKNLMGSPRTEASIPL